MPPIASFAVFVAVIGLTEAVEGDTYDTYRNSPGNAPHCHSSVLPAATTPDPHITSLPQGGTCHFAPVFTHDLEVSVCGNRLPFPYGLQMPRIGAA